MPVLMPVRSTIHSSLVSRILANSALLNLPGRQIRAASGHHATHNRHGIAASVLAAGFGLALAPGLS